MRNLFGKLEVSKTLGFAVHSVLRAQIMFRATGYNGRVSINPLYPTYKTPFRNTVLGSLIGDCPHKQIPEVDARGVVGECV